MPAPSLLRVVACTALLASFATLTNKLHASELGDLARETANNYQPLDAADVADAKARLQSSVDKLEKFLAKSPEKAAQWKEHMLWENIAEAVGEEGKFAPGKLLESLGKLRSNEPGLELPAFQELAQSLENYINVAAIGGVGPQAAYMTDQLNQLGKYLDRHADAPAARSRYEIERRLYLLENIGAVPELRAAIYKQLAGTNGQIVVSSGLLSRLANQSVSDTSPLRDCILGTSITGTGTTTGDLSVETLANDNGAMIRVVFTGTTLSNTVGYNGPVVIRSDGSTSFHASKKILLTDETFWQYPTSATADTTTSTRSIKKRGGGIGSGIIERMASSRVAEQRPLANRIASRNAEKRIAESLDDELLPRLRRARKRYEQDFRKPMQRVNGLPVLDFSTTAETLQAIALLRAPSELGADTPQPELATDGDVRFTLHESAPANLLTAWIGGATLSQKQYDKPASLDRPLPTWLEDAIDDARAKRDEDRLPPEAESFRPWSVAFRRQRPVSLEFAENTFRVTIHATKITVGEGEDASNYDGWDISAKYQLHTQNGQLILIRDGEIDVLPSAFDPAEGGKLKPRQVALRANLIKEINRLADDGRGFPDSSEIGPIDLSEETDKVSVLLFDSLETAAGWLSATLSIK